MANLFRGRLAQTEGAHFAQEEKRLVQQAAERLKKAAGAEAAARRGAIARAAAANAPAPTVDVLPEVRWGAAAAYEAAAGKIVGETRCACPTPTDGSRAALAATGCA